MQYRGGAHNQGCLSSFEQNCFVKKTEVFFQTLGFFPCDPSLTNFKKVEMKGFFSVLGKPKEKEKGKRKKKKKRGAKREAQAPPR